MQKKFFEINDAIYAYTVQGNGDPVILLHGFTASTRTWSELASKLAKDFCVYTIDLPGHGETAMQIPRTMETVSQDIAAWLDFLQLDKVNLLGYSMGGRTALSFAMYYPERVETLILESASPGLSDESERQARKANDLKLASRIMDDGIISFVDFWQDIPLFATQKKLPEAVQQTIRLERLAQTEEGLAMSLKYMGTGSQPSWWENLRSFKQAVLLLAGSIDEKFVQINKRMEKSFPNATYVIIENVGHAIHIEQAEKFVKIVREFLKANKNK